MEVKDIKILKEDQVKYTGSGSFGEYYQIKRTRTGIKTNRRAEPCKTIEEVLNSHEFKGVVKEFKRLKRIRMVTNLVPKPKYIAVIERKDHTGAVYYVPGYVMNHVIGTLVAHVNMTFDESKRLEEAKLKLDAAGILQIDQHTANIIKTSNSKKAEFIFIDAGGLKFKRDVTKNSCEWG